MLRHISSIVRRHGLTSRRYASTQTLRVARIGKLPEGYNVNEVLRASAGMVSPIEQIVPCKDHILIRFFDEDLAKRFCLTKTSAYMENCEYDSPVPPVSTKTAAHCGLGAQRKVRLVATTPLTMETVHAALSRYGDPAAIDIRIHEGIAYIDFADVNSAIKVVTSPNITGLLGAKFDYFEKIRQLRLPQFVSRAAEMQLNAKRSVVISGIQDVAKVEEAVWSAVGSKTSDKVLDSQFVAERNAMVFLFSTALFAKEFRKNFRPDFLSVNATMVKSHMYKSAVIAIGMGASRTLQIGGVGSQDQAQFSQFGPMLQAVQKGDITEITYKSFWDSMNALLQLESGNHAVTGFDGASISFSKTEPVTIAPPQLPPSSEPSQSLGGKTFVGMAQLLVAEALTGKKEG